MTAFHAGDVVLDQAAEPHDFNGMGAEDILIMVLKRQVEEHTGEENNDYGAGSGAGEKLEVEMLLAKKPSGEAVGKAGAAGFSAVKRAGLDCQIGHNCHRADPLPFAYRRPREILNF